MRTESSSSGEDCGLRHGSDGERLWSTTTVELEDWWNGENKMWNGLRCARGTKFWNSDSFDVDIEKEDPIAVWKDYHAKNQG